MAKPMDNLTLDVIDAQRLGYGCHYGHYKADHPSTATANEDRVAKPPRRRAAGQLVYEKVCIFCNRRYLANYKGRKYCSDVCKKQADLARNRKNKQEEKAND